MKRIVNDTLISVGAVVALLAILISVDPRVRDQLAAAARGTSITEAGTRLGDTGALLLTAAREQSVEHAPFAIFVIVGLALFVWMARS
jgi:hypothetical protein